MTVHNRELKETEGKFLILEVLDKWDTFDPDYHHPGTYISWSLDCAVEEEDTRKKNNKGKKIANGKRFRQMANKIGEVNEEEDEEVVEEEVEQEIGEVDEEEIEEVVEEEVEDEDGSDDEWLEENE